MRTCDNLTKEVSSGHHAEVNLHIAQLFHTMMQQVEPTDDDGRAQGAINLNCSVRRSKSAPQAEVGAATLVLTFPPTQTRRSCRRYAELGVKLLHSATQPSR